MNGIYLKDCIENFGFKIGIAFWVRWSIIDPLKLFYWKYIIAKPFCKYHGYLMCNSECNYPKITGRKNIIEYEKARKNQIEEESKIIIGSKDGICAYCGQEKGTEIIDDPNWDTLKRWLVCKTCEKIIELQRELSFCMMTGDSKRTEEINRELMDISIRTKKEINNIEIDLNKGEYFGVTYNGKK